MSLSQSLPPFGPNSDIGAGVGVDYKATMSTMIISDHSQPHQKCEAGSNGSNGRMAPPLLLTPKVKEDDGCVHSLFSQVPSKIPCSLLVNSSVQTNQDEKQQEQQTEILDFVRGILHVAATNREECEQQKHHDRNFVTPIIRRSKASVDCSGLNKLLLDKDSGEEYEDGEACEATVNETTSETNNTVTPESSQLVTNQTQRGVRFETEAPSVKYTISREDMTHEEKRSFWLQDEEFALIRLRDGYLSTLAEQQQRQMAAATGQSSETIPPPSTIPVSSTHWICARGLELKMKLRYLRTQSKRLANLENVLIEQERQWDDHWDDGRNLSPFHYDDEAIAAVCNEISEDCLIHAQIIAANDRKEVEEFLQVEEGQGCDGERSK